MHGILLDGQRSALPGRTGCEFHILVGDRITKTADFNKIAYGAFSKLKNAIFILQFVCDLEI